MSGLGSRSVSAGHLGLGGLFSNDSLFSKDGLSVNSARVPQFKRLRPRAKCRPDQQNFLDLTHGIPLQERVRWMACVEHRGIMVKQLELLTDFIMKRTSLSTGIIQGWTDSHSGEQLICSTISLEQVLHWVIQPMTRPVKCSYVEAVAISEDSQKPTWFVSHRVGGPLFELVNCTKKHAQTRYPSLCSVTGAYWVCAFAMNPHTTTESDMNGFVNEQPFYKAMCMSRGVLLVLDSAGPATAFHRLWCCFELIVASTALNHLLLDISTSDSGSEPQILTDGLTDGEAAKLAAVDPDVPTVGWAVKNEREAHFPIDRIRDGLKIDIKDMSPEFISPSDRMNIMKALAGNDGQPRFQVFMDDPTYDLVSKRLRAKVANLALRQLIHQGKDYGEFADELSQAIAENPDSDSFDLNLESGNITNSGIITITNCIPQTGKVRRANINLGHCYKISKVQPLLDTLSQLGNLQELSVNFDGCTGLTSVEELSDFASAISHVDSLKNVKLNFQGCDKLGPLDDFVQEMKRANIPSLQIISQDGTDEAAEEKVINEKPKARPKPKPKQNWVSETAKLWSSGKR